MPQHEADGAVDKEREGDDLRLRAEDELKEVIKRSIWVYSRRSSDGAAMSQTSRGATASCPMPRRESAKKTTVAGAHGTSSWTRASRTSTTNTQCAALAAMTATSELTISW
jgi:hypothetical protein